MGDRNPAAVFLDRDGTLMEDRGYISDPADVVLYPQTVPALRRLQERFLLFIVTNQSGIGRGLHSLNDVDRVNARLLDLLRKSWVRIAGVYYCPHAPEEECDCRKPSTGLIERATAVYPLDISRSYVVGDHPSDMRLADNAGCRGVYVLSGHGAKHREALDIDCPVVFDISEATDWILENR